MRIKDPHSPADRKFRALLMLKDLMKMRHKILIDYTETKILRRLFTLAKAPQRQNVLIIYDPKADLKKSKDFYNLLLECIDNWGLKYGTTNPDYLEDRQKLIVQKILPVGVYFMNYPGDDDDVVYTQFDDIDQTSLGFLIRDETERVKNSKNADNEQVTRDKHL